MIIVKSIEIITVDRDHWELLSLTEPYQAVEVFTPDKNKPSHICSNTFRELIIGRRFVKPNGEELLIGCSKQAEEIMGIHYDSWDGMLNQLEESRAAFHTIKELQLKTEKHLMKIRSLGFFERLVAVFRGYE